MNTTRLPNSLQKLVRQHKDKDDALAYVIRQVPGGQKAILALLSISDDPQALAVVKAWKKIKHHGDQQFGQRIEDVLEKAELTPRDFVGLVSRVGYDFNIHIGRMIAGFSYPDMMKRSMKTATTDPDATREREIHFKASGYLPTAPGIQIGMKQVNNNNGVEEEVVPGHSPSFARTARAVVRELPPGKP